MILKVVNRQPSAGDLRINLLEANRQPPAGVLTAEKLTLFLSIGFTHHCEIIAKTKTLDERLFYIEQCALEFWSKETLRFYLKSKLFSKRGKLPNNFQSTIQDKDLERKA